MEPIACRPTFDQFCSATIILRLTIGLATMILRCPLTYLDGSKSGLDVEVDHPNPRYTIITFKDAKTYSNSRCIVHWQQIENVNITGFAPAEGCFVDLSASKISFEIHIIFSFFVIHRVNLTQLLQSVSGRL